MNRRRYLALLGAVSLAGCSGSEQPESGTTSEPMTPQDQTGDTPTGTARPTDTPTEAETDSPTETATATEQATVDLSVGDPAVITVDRGHSTTQGGAVSVTNTGTAPTKTVECAFDWFDTDGEYIDSSTAYARAIGAGTTWAARTLALGVDAEIGGTEVTVTTDDEPAILGVEGVTLSDTQFRASADNVVLRGTATNERNTAVDYIEALGGVYDAEGTLLATGWTNESDLAAGGTWSFELQPRTVGRNDQVEEGKIILTEGFS